jgi:hypothetical protein
MLIRPRRAQEVPVFCVKVGNELIEKSEEVERVLGFMVSSHLDTNFHTESNIKKARARLWAMRSLKVNKVSIDSMIRFYKTMVLPVINFGLAVNGTMMKNYEFKKLERLQRSFLQIIFGYNLSYDGLLNLGGVSRIEDRAKKLFDSFTKSLSKSSLVGGDFSFS